MIKISRKGKRYALIVIMLLLTAYLLRFANENIWGMLGYDVIPEYSPWVMTIISLIRVTIYTGVIIVWGFSVHYRVLHPQIRRIFAIIAALMVFWMVIRQIKFMAVDIPDLKRYLWYLYYIPMLFIPMLSFMIAMYLGRPEDYHLPKWTRFLPLAATALLLLVLTNDLHELVFTFPNGAWGSDDSDYGYAGLFYLVFGWRIAGLLVTIGMIFWRSRIPQSRRLQIQPLIPSGLLLIYGILYLTGVFNDQPFLENITIIECLLEIAIFESCFRCGLLQANTHYAELFGILGYPGIIVDEAYQPVCLSDDSVTISKEQMRQAENETVEIKEGLLLKSMPIRNGHILWTENVAELMALQTEAGRMTKELSEEKELLQAEIEMKQKQAVVTTRNHLYDAAAHEIASQFMEIDRLVSASYQNDDDRKTAMRRMCVIGAYIKRRCNLLFISEEAQEISSDELILCLRESADYIRFYGADCTLNVLKSEMISTQNAKLAYDIFERVVENVLATLSAMLVYIEPGAMGLTMKLQAECGISEINFSNLSADVERQNGELHSVCEEGVLYTRLFLPKGGNDL